MKSHRTNYTNTSTRKFILTVQNPRKTNTTIFSCHHQRHWEHCCLPVVKVKWHWHHKHILSHTQAAVHWNQCESKTRYVRKAKVRIQFCHSFFPLGVIMDEKWSVASENGFHPFLSLSRVSRIPWLAMHAWASNSLHAWAIKLACPWF